MLLQAQRSGQLAGDIGSDLLCSAHARPRQSEEQQVQKNRCQQAGVLWQAHRTFVTCAGHGAEGGTANGQVRPDSKDAASAAPSGGDDPVAAARLQEVRVLVCEWVKAVMFGVPGAGGCLPGPSVAAATVHHL